MNMVHFLLTNKGNHITNGNIYKCIKCKKQYKSQATFQKHTCLYCNKCDKIYSTSLRLKQHVCSNETSFLCDRCDKLLKSAKSLHAHKCPFCSKCETKFSSYQRLSTHKCKKVKQSVNCAVLSDKTRKQHATQTQKRTSNSEQTSDKTWKQHATETQKRATNSEQTTDITQKLHATETQKRATNSEQTSDKTHKQHATETQKRTTNSEQTSDKTRKQHATETQKRTTNSEQTSDKTRKQHATETQKRTTNSEQTSDKTRKQHATETQKRATNSEQTSDKTRKQHATETQKRTTNSEQTSDKTRKQHATETQKRTTNSEQTSDKTRKQHATETQKRATNSEQRSGITQKLHATDTQKRATNSEQTSDITLKQLATDTKKRTTNSEQTNDKTWKQHATETQKRTSNSEQTSDKTRKQHATETQKRATNSEQTTDITQKLHATETQKRATNSEQTSDKTRKQHATETQKRTTNSEQTSDKIRKQHATETQKRTTNSEQTSDKTRKQHATETQKRATNSEQTSDKTRKQHATETQKRTTNSEKMSDKTRKQHATETQKRATNSEQTSDKTRKQHATETQKRATNSEQTSDKTRKQHATETQKRATNSEQTSDITLKQFATDTQKRATHSGQTSDKSQKQNATDTKKRATNSEQRSGITQKRDATDTQKTATNSEQMKTVKQHPTVTKCNVTKYHTKRTNFTGKTTDESNTKSFQDIVITSQTAEQLFFTPVRGGWQRKMSAQFHLRGRETFTQQTIHRQIDYPTKIKHIQGDGNCFFRCISYVITGTEENHSFFRLSLIQHMLNNPYLCTSLLERHQTVENYIQNQNLAENNTWASQTEIFMMAHLLNTHIYLYTYSGHRYHWLKHSAQFVERTNHVHPESIYLNHPNGNHYEVVLDVAISFIPDTFSQEPIYKELKHQCMKEKKSILNQQHNNENLDRRNCSSKYYMRKERERDRLREKRKSLEFREQENERDRKNSRSRTKQREIKKQKRQSLEVRKEENERKRSSLSNRYQEKEKKQMKRQSTEVRKDENERKRSSLSNRYQEKEKKQMKRQSTQVREEENERKRSSLSNRYQEKEKKQLKRQSSKVREEENKRKRSSVSNRYKEKEHKQLKRSSSSVRQEENEAKKAKKETSDVNILIQNFHDFVKEGPIYRCTCCDQTFYRESVQLAITLRTQQYLSTLFPELNSGQEKEWICHTCSKYIKDKKLPPLSKIHFKFPLIPPCLQLTNLEERLVAPRIPFMMLHELPRGGQISLTGNVVNVPSNVNTTVTHLPRLIDDNSCIPLKLKRQISKHNHVTFENVRPNIVRNALQYLVENSELYQQEGITINEHWTPNISSKDADGTTDSKILAENTDDREHNYDVGDYQNIDNGIKSDTELDSEQQPMDIDSVDSKKEQSKDWDEDAPEDQPGGCLDTMLQAQDLVADDKNTVFSFAPAEGNQPVSVFTDKFSEELSFPTLFCGEKRNCPPKLSYNDICKAELRHVDRRVAGHIPNIFYKLKKLQAKHIFQKSNIMIRKTKGKAGKKAGDLKSTDQLKDLCRVDEGYRIFKDLRGSPPYWERTKKDLFAMLRVLGIPTWFMSFSSAETRWVHLLKILSQSVNNKTLSTDDVNQLTFQQKSQLIRKDPVTCSRHFHHQVKKLINDLLKSSASPVGTVCDYFYKVEFQMRGSPHIHMLVWVSDAPKLEDTTESQSAVLQFIDEHSTCSRDDSISHLISLQEHNHSRTCKKKNDNICRFGYPIPIMNQTCILEPLESAVPDGEKKRLKEIWDKITKTLNDFRKETTDIMTYEDYLIYLDVSEEDYINAVRSSIHTKKVFLKRGVNETRINAYNHTLLSAWRANMDIQFVIDAYACAVYVVSYIAKSQRGMSNLLYHATEEARQGNKDVTAQVRSIGHKFLNHVEISAQEAVFYILQLPLKMSSRDVIFINTSPAEERVAMLKSPSVLNSLPDDCFDVQAKSIIDRYAERPSCLEDICLAEFCSNYKLVYKNSGKKRTMKNNDDDNSDDDADVDNDGHDYLEMDDDSSVHIQDGKGNKLRLTDGNFIAKRGKPVIIRYVRYQQTMDQENYFREILMLFVPWRDEHSIIGDSETYTQQFLSLNGDESVTEKMDQYHHTFPELDQAIEDASEINMQQLASGWKDVAPHTHAEEAADEATELVESEQYQSLAPITSDIKNHSDFVTAPLATKCEILKNCLPEEEYMKIARSLNSEQMMCFLHILNEIKVQKKPIYYFLSGGAGVGKTVLVKVIYQALIRWFNSDTACDPDKPTVLLGAPTGKAAYLIKGNTLHSLLHIPANQGFSYKPLAADKLNTYRTKFSQVKLLIIDEVSMVGNAMFSYINQRLQQIMGTTRLFGGISILAVGDLYQLKPVFDGWIFKPLVNEYGPLATNLWKENFQLYELTTIMRQKDSKVFAQVLNRLRQNKQTKADIALLKKQLINTDLMRPDYPIQEPHIYQKNTQVTFHNDMVCELQGQQTISNNCIDVVLGDVTPAVKEKIHSKIPKETSKTMGLSKQIKTSVGLRHELSCNVDIEDGLANGASCILKSAGPVDKRGHYRYLWVQFDIDDIGKLCRRKNSHLYTNTVDAKWTPVFRIKRQFPVGRYKNALVMRDQFPIRCASAKTCHRCQGDTMDSAVIDLSGTSFPHAHYVALSRVTKLDNLKIRCLNENKIRVDRAVTKEMTDLLANELQLEEKFNVNMQNGLSIMHLNIRSLRKHILDLRAVPYSPDILILSETKLNTKDMDEFYKLPGYRLRRHDCSNSTYGLAVFVKEEVSSTLIAHEVQSTNSSIVEVIIYEFTTQDMPRVIVAGLYASPKLPKRKLNSFISNTITTYPSEDCPCVLLGDFNVNFLFDSINIESMQPCITQPTTDYGSLLDQIYVNMLVKVYKCGTFDSYFSDHKVIYISLHSN